MPFSNTNALRNTAQTTASDATRLRVLAGTPHSRRGSVLVLVVGVLALLAIIIVVYTSVGQADVRGARTLVNQARLDDQSHAISDYIRTVIGNDASAVRIQQVAIANGTTVNLAVREGIDYPFTDPSARSILTNSMMSRTPTGMGLNAQFARFDPAGNITRQWTVAGGALDPRTASDPFLATTEPTWINRGFANLPGTMPSPFQLLGRQRDWGHMSIISPNGLPVNLANLRGNWSAASGFPERPYNAPPLMMSDWLHTWTRANDTVGYGATPNVTRAPNTPAGTDLYNSPAYWSNDCLETFRPVTWNPGKYYPGDVRFMGNMLGDADGDGFYDSRWQELVDVSDPARPIHLLPGGTGGGVRWFIAPRIVDLSSLVNVNVGTSFAVPPDVENPAGLTPSDVDLERLLTTADARQYFGVDPAAHYVMGNMTYSANPLDITNAGRWAFAGILEGRATGLVETIDNPYVDQAGTGLTSPVWLADMGVQRTGGAPALGAVTRKLLYTLGGKDPEDGQLRTPAGTTANHYLKQPGGYGMADERELRIWGGVNDPSVNARIEATSASLAFSSIPNNALMNPFRFGRDLVTDRDAGLNLAPANMAGTGADAVPRAMAQYFTDARHLLTTISGARPLAYTLVGQPLNAGASAARTITEAELRVDVDTLLQNALAMNTQAQNTARRVYPLSAANSLFSNYAIALSPFLGSVGINAPSQSLWNEADTGNNLRNLSLSFGGVTYNSATTGTDVGETVNPLFKGRVPIIGVRTAAHLAINAMAARDNTKFNAASTQPDNRPMAATVLLDEGQRNTVSTGVYPGPGNVQRFPFWHPAGTARLGGAETASHTAFGTSTSDIKAFTFDLNGGQPGTIQRLAGSAGSAGMTNGEHYAVNVFAAQPQPFVTAAVSFDMYYDAPGPQGGDSMASSRTDIQGEWIVRNPGDPANNIPPILESLGITIKGDVSLANPDFMMETVAFQVTNPFDVPLTLGDATGGFSYYFEFAGKFYDARPYDAMGNPINAVVTIQPRESLCFYILSQDPANITSRWRRAEPAVNTLPGAGNDAVTSWIKKQLTVTTGGGDVYRTMEITPSDPNNRPPAAALHQSLASSPTSDDNKVVKLWRVVLDRSAGETIATNKTENDYLVDRLHDPSFGTGARAALYRRLNTDHNRFNVPAGPEPTDAPYYNGSNQMENIGYAITMFGAVRRRTDPSGGPLPGQQANTTTGVMPAWCLEARDGNGFTAPANARNVTDANTGFPNSSITGSVGVTDFTGHKWGGSSFRNMIINGVGQGYTTASVHPATRRGVGAAGAGAMGDDRNDKITVDLAGIDWIAGGKQMQLPVYPRRSTVAGDTVVTLPPLRPADLLMPWAIGPYQYGDIDPVAIGAANYHAVEDARHTTLSEAMALGLNYSRGTDDKTYEFQIGQVLDRCHLPLDRQVPFNDANSNGVWDYNSGNADPFIANGVPFALNILDRFRTSRYGSVDSAVPGVININTAPLSVLRMLPFLTPASAHVFNTDNAAFQNHWMNSTTTGPFALKLTNETGTTNNAASLWANNEQWDLAATLVAYRDQLAVIARGQQGDESGNSRRYVDFSRGTATVSGNDGNEFDTPAGKHTGRAFMNNVVNARQDRGFQTAGEVLLALVRDTSTRTGQTLNDVQQRQLGMDRMERKLNTPTGTQVTQNNFHAPVHPIVNVNARGLPGSAGTESARNQPIGLTGMPAHRRAPTGTTEGFVQGGKSTDYDRKIAIANALLNTVSTSSDIYCAYFLVNGYTEGDTQGLETWTGNAAPTEDRYTRPMTPSIQRRFMMVLDRSACIRPGDKPKVLMFEELPVK